MPNEKTISDFVKGLASDSMRLDRFVRVLGRLEALGNVSELQALEDELREVKGQIDEVNRNRDTLRIQKEDLSGALVDLDRAIKGSTPGPDLLQMQLVLLKLDAELDEKIATSRPGKLHARKVQLRNDIAARKLLSRLATMIGSAARNRRGTH